MTVKVTGSSTVTDLAFGGVLMVGATGAVVTVRAAGLLTRLPAAFVIVTVTLCLPMEVEGSLS